MENLVGSTFVHYVHRRGNQNLILVLRWNFRIVGVLKHQIGVLIELIGDFIDIGIVLVEARVEGLHSKLDRCITVFVEIRLRHRRQNEAKARPGDFLRCRMLLLMVVDLLLESHTSLLLDKLRQLLDQIMLVVLLVLR